MRREDAKKAKAAAKKENCHRCRTIDTDQADTRESASGPSFIYVHRFSSVAILFGTSQLLIRRENARGRRQPLRKRIATDAERWTQIKPRPARV
jgi:hypothetical protein